MQSFEKAVAEERKDMIGEATTATSAGNRGILSPNKIESTYDRWLKNVDEEQKEN